MKSGFLIRIVVLGTIIFAMQGCDSDFGKDTVQNEKDMKITVERFLAESKSALSGNKLQISDRLAAMRSRQLDLKAIDSTSKCASFQTEALAGMANVISAWERVASLNNEAKPGSVLFDFQMMEYNLDLSKLVLEAESSMYPVEELLTKGCISSTAVSSMNSGSRMLPLASTGVVELAMNLRG